MFVMSCSYFKQCECNLVSLKKSNLSFYDRYVIDFAETLFFSFLLIICGDTWSGESKDLIQILCQLHCSHIKFFSPFIKQDLL